MNNSQPIEKRLPSYEGVLDVHSIFKTIQGEGPFCGTPCVFIRLAGCNLQCPGCDTDYTSERHSLNVPTIVKQVRELFSQQIQPGLVVITGGEPFRQHIRELICELVYCGCYVQVESNGTMNPPEFNWNKNITERRGAYLVVSPKTGKINPLALSAAVALKYVVQHDNIMIDGLPRKALNHPCRPFLARPPEGWGGLIYVQPQDDRNEAMNHRNTAAAVQSCLEHGYILQLQIHKIIGME